MVAPRSVGVGRPHGHDELTEVSGKPVPIHASARRMSAPASRHSATDAEPVYEIAPRRHPPGGHDLMI
jgi:hypothetical protein